MKRAVYAPAGFDPSPRPAVIDFGSATTRRRSISSFLDRLTAMTAASEHLSYDPVGSFAHRAETYRLARYIFRGPMGDEEPIRIGIFAGIHGDEPESSQALIEFLSRLDSDPERGRGYQIFAYPICNPTGFEDNTHASRAGNDLNHEFWQGSQQPEVYYLERELGVINFHGVISLHAENRHGMHAHSRSSTIREALVRPALKAASRILPRTIREVVSDCMASEATGRKCHEGVLVDYTELNSAPFEIVLETPQPAPVEKQVEAAVAALDLLIERYRPFLANQQDI